MTADDDEVLIYHGGAKPGDQTFADVVAVNADVIAWLERRARRRAKQLTAKRNVNAAFVDR